MQSDLDEGKVLGEKISSLNLLVQNLDRVSVEEQRAPEKEEKTILLNVAPKKSLIEPRNVGADDASSKIIEFAAKYRNLNSIKSPSQEFRSRAPNNSPNRAKSITDFLSQGRLSFSGEKVKLSMKPPTKYRSNVKRNQPSKFVHTTKNFKASAENCKYNQMGRKTAERNEKYKFTVPPPAVCDMLTSARNKFKQPKPKIAVPLSIINLELI
jgi:hypothetical protein